MKKISLSVLAVVLFAALLFVSCENNNEIVTYTVKFDSDGGSYVESQVVEKGGYAVLPEAPTKEGYHFRGWTCSEGTYYSFKENAVSCDLTLKAVWSDAQGYYTVFFNSCGGSTVEAQKVKEGEKVTKPSDPVYAGYQFDGWVKEDEYVSFDFDKETVSKDITLYADWSIKTYKVTFDSNGGSEVNSQVVVQGEKAVKPDNPIKAGSDFKGWIKSDNTLFNFESEKIDGDITLKAVWYDNYGVYTVTFNSDGGSGVTSRTVKKWTKLEKPDDPTKSGHNFVC